MLIQKSNKNQKLSQTINELPEDITSDKYSNQINEIYQNLVENQKSLVSTELSKKAHLESKVGNPGDNIGENDVIKEIYEIQ